MPAGATPMQCANSAAVARAAGRHFPARLFRCHWHLASAERRRTGETPVAPKRTNVLEVTPGTANAGRLFGETLRAVLTTCETASRQFSRGGTGLRIAGRTYATASF